MSRISGMPRGPRGGRRERRRLAAVSSLVAYGQLSEDIFCQSKSLIKYTAHNGEVVRRVRPGNSACASTHPVTPNRTGATLCRQDEPACSQGGAVSSSILSSSFWPAVCDPEVATKTATAKDEALERAPAAWQLSGPCLSASECLLP